MKKYNFLIVILCCIPVVYLWSVYSQLPDLVPTHFGIDMKPDDYSSKSSTIIQAILPGIVAIILWFSAKYDPKNQLKDMGSAFHRFAVMFCVAFVILSCYMIYISIDATRFDGRILLAIIGLLFLSIGNFMPAMRPNFFIGIRTPWTLSSDEVWKNTHRLASYGFSILGISFIIVPFIIFNQTTMLILFGLLISFSLGIVGYSFYRSSQINKL